MTTALTGKVAVVTGASRGIGRQIAAALASRGAKVVLAARTVEPRRRLPGTIGETLKAIQDAGGTAVAVPCDVAVPADLERLVATAVGTFGRLDVLGLGSMVGYASTKAALNRLSNALAPELAADNIAITCVDPGFTRTELVDILGQRGLVDPSAAHPMEVPVAAVLDVITSDDPLTRSGHVIRA